MTKRAIVPAMVTEAMYEAVESPGSIQQSWERMLAASPGSGCVSRADLERAAQDAWDSDAGFSIPWNEAHVRLKHQFRQNIADALQALGLSLEPGIQDERGGWK